MPAAPSVLAELKTIRYERGTRSPFKDHTEFLRWSDKAEPLLAFHPGFTEEFKGSVHSAKNLLGWKEEKYDGAINNAIGVVNKAITLLETQVVALEPAALAPEVQSRPLAAPDRVTLKWLYEHVPFPLAAGAVGTLVAAFLLGLAFSETKMYALVKSTVAMPSVSTASPAANTTEGQPKNVSHTASSPK
jgi:hypothetical protein